jgi:hypothetical protein
MPRKREARVQPGAARTSELQRGDHEEDRERLFEVFLNIFHPSG